MSQQPQWQPTNPPVPPARQQGWFARNKVLSIVLGVVLLIVLCCCGAGLLAVGSDTETDSGGSTTQESSDSAAADDSSAKESAQEPAPVKDSSTSPTKDKKKKPKEKTEPKEKAKPAKEPSPGVGTPVRDGKFEFTVTQVETGVPEVGSEYLKEKADGQFVLVHITVKNIGDEPQTLFDSEQKLLDAGGRSFSTDTTASIYMEDNDVWINEINPGNSVQGTLVYDMPADVQPAEIELHDSMFSDGVTLSLK